MIATYKRSFVHRDYYKIVILDKHYNEELLLTDSLAYNFLILNINNIKN